MNKQKLFTLLAAAAALLSFKPAACKASRYPGKEMIQPASSQTTYEIDPAKSSFNWTGKKVTGEHSGTITISSGKISSNKGLLNGGAFEIDMNSITDTDMDNPEYAAKLVKHLKSEDFFDVAKFPTASFKIKVWAPIKDAAKGAVNYYVKGDLTIKGVTKEITFPAIVNADENTVTAAADFNINRTDFDVKYGSSKFFPDIGNKMVYDEFNVKINFTANKK
jgi:polyisoprenoid-binding protein YceI